MTKTLRWSSAIYRVDERGWQGRLARSAHADRHIRCRRRALIRSLHTSAPSECPEGSQGYLLPERPGNRPGAFSFQWPIGLAVVSIQRLAQSSPAASARSGVSLLQVTVSSRPLSSEKSRRIRTSAL